MQGPPEAERAVQAVAEVLSVVRGSTIAELEVEWAGGSVRVQREPGLAVARLADVESDAKLPDDRIVVTSEHVGIAVPARGSALPQPGQTVVAGARLAEIETLGIRSAVVAPIQGFVAEVLIEEGEAVEYGQQLFVLSTSPLPNTPGE